MDLTDKLGIQLCATIRKFDALDDMNSKTKEKKKMEGLELVVAFPSQAIPQISIHMPESFQV